MTTRRLLTRVSLVLAVLLLTGCAGEGAAIDGTPVAGGTETDAATDTAEEGSEDEPADDAAATRECLQGNWVEDMLNLENQWQNWAPGGQGLPVTGVSGQNTLSVTEDAMEYTVDTTVSTESPLDTGVTMTGESVTSGSASFAYEVHSPTSATVGPVIAQGVTALTRVYIDGALSSETPVNWDGGIEGPAIIWCEDDTLSFEPSVSGWIHLFTRA